MPRLAAAAGALSALALLAACSGEGGNRPAAAPGPTTVVAEPTSAPFASTSAPAASTTSSVTAAPAAVTCPPSTLALASREGLGALGHALYVLELRNTSSQPCRLAGYPAVSLVDAGGRVLAEAKPESGYILPDRPPGTVSLAPGGSAFFGVESYNVCNAGALPAVATSARVTPPGTTAAAALTVAAEMNVCPGLPVRVSPIRPTDRDIAP